MSHWQSVLIVTKSTPLSYLLSCPFQALSIYQNRDFITIYHAEQEGPNDFDTVLLKALVGGKSSWKCAEIAPYLRWDCTFT